MTVSTALASETGSCGPPDHFVTIAGWDVTLDEGMMGLGRVCRLGTARPTASWLR
jgi:hypothetical protein